MTRSAQVSILSGTLHSNLVRGLEIDHQLELVRQLHGKVSWLCAFEDFVYDSMPPAAIVSRFTP